MSAARRIEADPTLKAALAKVAKPNPVIRADAIVLHSEGNRVYLAGLNDDCHYYAVAELLTRLGLPLVSAGRIWRVYSAARRAQNRRPGLCLCAAVRGAQILAKLERRLGGQGRVLAAEFLE